MQQLHEQQKLQQMDGAIFKCVRMAKICHFAMSILKAYFGFSRPVLNYLYFFAPVHSLHGSTVLDIYLTFILFIGIYLEIIYM